MDPVEQHLMIVLHNQDVLQDLFFVLIKHVLLAMLDVKMIFKPLAHLIECSNVKIKHVKMNLLLAQQELHVLILK